MIRKISITVFILALCQVGAADTKKQSQPKAMTPSAVGDQIAQYLASKKDSSKESTPASIAAKKKKNKTAKSSNNQKTQASSGQTEASGSPSKSFSKAVKINAIVIPVKKVSPVTKPYVPPPAVKSAPQINQEIQKILNMNKQIRLVQSGKTGQFQRIQEQARIHQRILKDLEGQQKQQDTKNPPKKETLLAQEKLRIIREETDRNVQLMENATKDSTQKENSNSSAAVAPFSDAAATTAKGSKTPGA